MSLTAIPLLGFGSNQVDFGGMIDPASATLIISLTSKGKSINPILQSSLHRFSISLDPLIPPIKSILSLLVISLIFNIGSRQNFVNK